MLIKKQSDIPSSEITDERDYINRRQFMQAAGVIAATGLVGGTAFAGRGKAGTGEGRQEDKLTPFEDVTTFNNYYEFGTGKDEPAQNAHTLRPSPWSIQVAGHVAKPATYQLEDFIKPHKMEDRVYRLRCVEGWSMVIPWLGFPLADLVKRVQPTSRAKYIAFTTLYDPQRMPGQRRAVLDWPYKEGLRLDEAMHPLAILATGLYGKTLPNQNGAPIRLVVPWKYGFKSIKSIVKMDFVETQPRTAWNDATPHEYGFYANVNPTVDHPRWTQASERRQGEFRRRATLMFNGYNEVASLYSGMDLKVNY